MRFYLILLVAYIGGCSEGQPRSRTKLFNNAGASGGADADAVNGSSKAKNDSGSDTGAQDPGGEQLPPAGEKAETNGAAQAGNNTTSNGATLSPPTASQPTQAATNNPVSPAPPAKPDCPTIPTIDSPINGGDGVCGDACRDKLRKAAHYVNSLSTTKPNLNIPDGSKLQDKIVAQNLFRLIDAAGKNSGVAYKMACNPLEGKKYRP